jgi:acetyl-CoA synthetase
VAAAEPLNPDVIEQVRKAWGITVRDGFGRTETTAQAGDTPGSAVRLGSMGRPLPGYPVTLVDPATGTPRPGWRDLSGPGAAPARADNRLPGRRGAERLGDARRVLPHRRRGDQRRRRIYHYAGRTDDVFKASDYRISPFELESVLIEHAAVAEAAAAPRPAASSRGPRRETGRETSPRGTTEFWEEDFTW